MRCCVGGAPGEASGAGCSGNVSLTPPGEVLARLAFDSSLGVCSCSPCGKAGARAERWRYSLILRGVKGTVRVLGVGEGERGGE